MHHPKASVERLYMTRKNGGRGLLSLQQLHGQCMVSLARYVSTSHSPVLRILKYHHDEVLPQCYSITKLAQKYLEQIDGWGGDEYSVGKEELKKKRQEIRHEKVLGMPLHSQFWRRLEDIPTPDTMFDWMFSRHLKMTTEGLVLAAQDQALRTRNYEYAVMGSRRHGDAKCRLCREFQETVDHIVSACPVLARSSYISRHDSIVRYVHWCMSRKIGVLDTVKSHYGHPLVPITEHGGWKLMWEFTVPTDLPLKHNRPDIIVINQEEALLVDVSVPLDHNIAKKAARKRIDYKPLALEVARMWKVRCRVVPVIIGALGTHEPELGEMLSLLGGGRIATVQQLALCGTTRILRQFLGSSE